MKLVWLDLNCSYAHSSLALPALHAQCDNTTSVDWQIVSGTTNMPAGGLVNDLYRHKPDIVAATAWLFNLEELLHITGRLKALLPHCVIILGGPEFLGDNETFLHKNQFINCVFRGEGEKQFPLWLNNWNKPELWPSIDGLCWLDLQKNYQDNGIARVLDFDKLKTPESSRFFIWEKPFVQLETTRGCFNTCAFCVSGGEKPVRVISVEKIRQRLDDILKHGIRNVRVLDRTFNYNSSRAKQLLELFSEYTPYICFHLEIHPALLTEELKQQLSSLPEGLLHLEAGIQSLRSEVLAKSKRAGQLQQALEGLHFLCSLSNMQTHADLIAGLPLYHFGEMVEDIHTLASFGADEIQLESLKLLPGTAMRRDAENLGLQFSPYPPYEVLQTCEISVEELETSRHLSRLLDAYYNTQAWQEITRTLMSESNDFLISFLHYLVTAGVIDQPMSLDRRGTLLFEYCKLNYPAFLPDISVAWIAAGLSHKKEPAMELRTKRYTLPAQWDSIIKGQYSTELKMALLPTVKGNFWFGFEAESQQRIPLFIAHTESTSN